MMNQNDLRQLQTVMTGTSSSEKLSFLKKVLPTKDPEIAKCIVPCIKTEPDSKVKQAMIQSVGIVGKPEDLKNLLKLTEDPDSSVRLAMAKAIFQMGHGSFFPFLVRFLGDENKEVKNYCGEKLTGLGTDKLVALLNSMWEIPMPSMKLAAIKAARQFKTPALVPLLEKGLDADDDELVQESQKGIERLAKFGVTEAKKLLRSTEKEHNSNQFEIAQQAQSSGMTPCPHCKRDIRFEALKCRYCKSFIDEESLNAVLNKQQSGSRPMFYPANGTTRIAAYFLDSLPVMVISIIPILEAPLVVSI